MQVEHKTEKGTVIFYLPPLKADRFDFFNDENPYLSYFIGHETFRQYFPEGFILIGLTSEVTEDQAKMMVTQSLHTGLFMHHNGLDNVYCYKSAVDSFKSIMQHLQVYEVNPCDEFDCPNQFCDNGYIDQGYNDYWRCSFCQENEYNHEEAECRTGKFIVLFKPNEK